MANKMIFALILLCFGAASVEASQASSQDWYDNACTTSCTQYNSADGAWNYDYTQGQNGVACGSCTTLSKCGPYCWDQISGTNYCGDSAQTPIDLSFSKATDDNSIEFPTFMTTGDYDGCDDFNLFADDHAFEISAHDAACEKLYAEYDGEEYFFHQLHFHFPSEHTFNGFHSAEVHMVHKNAAMTKFFVVGAFLDVVDGVTNHPFLKPFYDIYIDQGAAVSSDGTPDMTDSEWSNEFEIENFKDQHTELKLNPYRDFVPTNPAFFHYTGSLTTFPCTEGVQWFMYEEALKIGQWDLGMLKASVRSVSDSILESPGDITDLSNNRPVNPLNDRTLYYSTGYADEVTADDDSKQASTDDKAADDKAADDDMHATDDDNHMTTVTGVAIAAIVIGCLGLAIALIAFGFSLAKMYSRGKVYVDNKGSVNA